MQATGRAGESFPRQTQGANRHEKGQDEKRTAPSVAKNRLPGKPQSKKKNRPSDDKRSAGAPTKRTVQVVTTGLGRGPGNGSQHQELEQRLQERVRIGNGQRRFRKRGGE